MSPLNTLNLSLSSPALPFGSRVSRTAFRRFGARKKPGMRKCDPQITARNWKFIIARRDVFDVNEKKTKKELRIFPRKKKAPRNGGRILSLYRELVCSSNPLTETNPTCQRAALILPRRLGSVLAIRNKIIARRAILYPAVLSATEITHSQNETSARGAG